MAIITRSYALVLGLGWKRLSDVGEDPGYADRVGWQVVGLGMVLRRRRREPESVFSDSHWVSRPPSSVGIVAKTSQPIPPQHVVLRIQLDPEIVTLK